MRKIMEEKLYKCIYCKSKGPFNDEHVFPFGLGGDDPDYILVNMVCKECNGEVFSKFEAALMRRSTVAFIRMFQEQGGRKKIPVPNMIL